MIQLNYNCGLSHQLIAKFLTILLATVSNHIKKATELGINTWPSLDKNPDQPPLKSTFKINWLSKLITPIL